MFQNKESNSFSNQSTLKNLRLISTIKEGQYLSTTSSGDIECIIEENIWSDMFSIIYRENWTSNLFALRKLYVSDVDDLLEMLIKEDKRKELFKLKELLEKSVEGLLNLKIVFSEPNHNAQIECLAEDYIDTYISYIEDSL